MAAQRLSPDAAAALLGPVDTLGIPLGPGQPPALLAALGQREDWEDLRVGGALLAVGTELFTRPGVHYLSGFFGPLERALRDQGANISFVPADFRRFAPLLEEQAPRVMCTVAAPPDAGGWCSLSLHAGGTVTELRRAGADPGRLLVVEAAAGFPNTAGLAPDFPHALHVDEIDVLVESGAAPLALADPQPTDADRAIAEHAARFVPDGATLQTGIGSIPSTIVSLLAEGDGGGYGVHSEMFTTGLMRLHEAGKVVNEKGRFDGVSVTTFAFGTEELYAWLDGNQDVAFLPVEIVKLPRRDRPEPAGGDGERGARRRYPRPGRGRHDRRRPVLRDRRPRGLRRRPRPLELGALADLPALHGPDRRRAPLADRAVVRRRHRRDDAAPPGRCRHHRVRSRRASGQDGSPAR